MTTSEQPAPLPSNWTLPNAEARIVSLFTWLPQCALCGNQAGRLRQTVVIVGPTEWRTEFLCDAGCPSGEHSGEGQADDAPDTGDPTPLTRACLRELQEGLDRHCIVPRGEGSDPVFVVTCCVLEGWLWRSLACNRWEPINNTLQRARDYAVPLLPIRWAGLIDRAIAAARAAEEVPS